MNEIKPPSNYQFNDKIKIFAGGSIEMGLAENWQDRLKLELTDKDVVLLNPRRDDWDSSWIQSAANPNFSSQVNWELGAINSADIVVFYFDPNTKSPVTLMELGLQVSASPDKLIVCCPDGFWRKGNVDIVCIRNNVKLVACFDDFIREILAKLVNLQ